MIKQTDLVGIFGKRGSGKSTLCRSLLDCYPRVVIFDLVRDYEAPDCDYLCADLVSFARVLDYIRAQKLKKFRVVLQFDVENSDVQADFDLAVRAVYEFGNCALIIEELHHYGMTKWLQTAILVGRHRGVGIVGTSQRPANVPKTFVSQCEHVFCARLFEKNDLSYFQDTIGETAQLLPNLGEFEFVHYRPGSGVQIVPNR